MVFDVLHDVQEAITVAVQGSSDFPLGTACESIRYNSSDVLAGRLKPFTAAAVDGPIRCEELTDATSDECSASMHCKLDEGTGKFSSLFTGLVMYVHVYYNI